MESKWSGNIASFAIEDTDLVDFSIQKHGCLCKNHLDEDEYRMQLSRKALYVARQLALVNTPKQIGSIQLSGETTSELRRLFDTIMDEYVGDTFEEQKILRSDGRMGNVNAEKRTRLRVAQKRCLYLTF